MTINTRIWCDNCAAALRLLGYAAEPHNVVLHADTLQPGWKFAPDGGHLCPDCDDYDDETREERP